MRFALPILTAGLLLAACGGEPDQTAPAATTAETPAAITQAVATMAVLKRDLDLTACLQEESANPDAALSSCPMYVLHSLDFMVQECSRAGGTLQPTPESEAWSLDVDGDGKNEVLIDLTENFTCYGAPSVFSCGSLGCPYFLYSQRGDAWMELGAVNADDAPGIEVLAATAGTPGTLRGGCGGQKPCSELAYYAWHGTAYEWTWIEFHGHLVDVAPYGLSTLAKHTALTTAPAEGATVVDSYPAGTTVVVIGTARGAPYQFVSPCNACPRGFVETAALKK